MLENQSLKVYIAPSMYNRYSRIMPRPDVLFEFPSFLNFKTFSWLRNLSRNFFTPTLLLKSAYFSWESHLEHLLVMTKNPINAIWKGKIYSYISRWKILGNLDDLS